MRNVMIRRGGWAWVLALTLMILAVPMGTARAGEVYYVMIFGSQSRPKQLRYTHTWATFVRATGEGPDPNSYALESTPSAGCPRPWRSKSGGPGRSRESISTCTRPSRQCTPTSNLSRCGGRS